MTVQDDGYVSDSSELALAPPRVQDGAAIWRLIRDAGELDVNSPYLYLLIGAHFRDTSIVARLGGELVGVITGYRPPGAGDVLFVWQVGVAASARGRGVASAMLTGLIRRPACAGVRFVETTVTESNQASRAMFASFARRMDAACAESAGFGHHLFPAEAGAHDDERLLRIGPFSPTSTTSTPDPRSASPTEPSIINAGPGPA